MFKGDIFAIINIYHQEETEREARGLPTARIVQSAPCVSIALIGPSGLFNSLFDHFYSLID